MLSSLKDSFWELRNYEHCEGEEKYENISVFSYFSFLYICSFFVFIVHLKHQRKGRCNIWKSTLKKTELPTNSEASNTTLCLNFPNKRKSVSMGDCTSNISKCIAKVITLCAFSANVFGYEKRSRLVKWWEYYVLPYWQDSYAFTVFLQ